MKRHLTHYYENKLPVLNFDPVLPESGGRAKAVQLDDSAEMIISINVIEDIVAARRQARAMAKQLGFSPTQATVAATVVSELASNIILYASAGAVELNKIIGEARTGMVITARDNGPGIDDLSNALTNGFSSSGGLGLGLPGVKHLSNEFRIDSQPGRGTTVTATLWR